MIPVRVVSNNLSEDVLARVLRVDEVKDGDPRWRLLRSGNTRKTFKFSPLGSSQSWVVKWGCNYTSLRQIRPALKHRDEATVEWEKTETAASRGIPVLRFSMLAAPDLRKLRIQTLLVSEFIEGALNVVEFLNENYHNESLTQDILIRLGRGMANIHKQGLLHRDFSLDNILVLPEGSSERILFIDWFKMREVNPTHDDPYRADLIAPVSDLIYIGFSERRIRPLLEAYSEVMPWCRDQIDKLISKGRENRKGVARRAYRNCNRKSRRLIPYRYNGYKVFQFKGADRQAVERAIDDGTPSETIRTSTQFRWAKKRSDSDVLKAWRIVNVLRMTGLAGHRVMAYAARKGLFDVREILALDQTPRGFFIVEILLPDCATKQAIERPSRREVLEQAGGFLRRLHYLSMGVRRVNLQEWRCFPAPGRRLHFSTDDLDSYIITKCDSFEDRFGWLRAPEFKTFSVRDLCRFLKGYGDSSLDRKTLGELLKYLS